jgi:hypothetical protein
VRLEHVIETDYHAPPVGDFGYGRGGMMDGYRDTFESWDAAGAGAYSMNAMFADGGMQTDYELSNINSVSMTPNGKYAIVGQSQGPPQIWDAVVSTPSHSDPQSPPSLSLSLSAERTIGFKHAGNEQQL